MLSEEYFYFGINFLLLCFKELLGFFECLPLYAIFCSSFCYSHLYSIIIVITVSYRLVAQRSCVFYVLNSNLTRFFCPC